MDNQDNQDQTGNSKQKTFSQSDIAPGVIKPRHLVVPTGSTLGNVPVSDGTNFSFTTLATFLPFLTGSKYVPIFGSNLPIGNNDLYTVPQGKKLLIISNGESNFYNASAGTIAFFGELKINETYYRIRSTVSINTGVSTSGNLSSSPIILNAGETISVNVATTAGLNLFSQGLLFDATNNIAGPRIINLSNGYNTLYTVPADKTATFIGSFLGASGSSGLGSIAIANSSGGSLNYFFNYVPVGSTASSVNQFFQATALANNAANTFPMTGAFLAGDSLTVNTSGGGAGQIAWSVLFEI